MSLCQHKNSKIHKIRVTLVYICNGTKLSTPASAVMPLILPGFGTVGIDYRQVNLILGFAELQGSTKGGLGFSAPRGQ